MTEHQHTEWKQSWRDEYLRWICGFANAEGGTLSIGRDDKGKAVGVKDARKLMEDIPNKVRDILGIMVDVNLRELAAGDVLDIVVPAYSNPISYRGEYCYRSGSTNQTLKGAALDRFMLRKQGRHWDGVPLPGVSVTQLSSPAIAAFRRNARESRRLDAAALRVGAAGLLDRLRLTEGKYLKRAAALLFHAEPDRLITNAYVKIGYFENNADLLYHDEVHGDLFTQVENAMDLLTTKYLRAGISYRRLQRLETLPVPEEALREALLNAVIHKDYGTATPIQISVYHDQLMIWNPGELPPDWNIARLTGKHPSQPYNPDVANGFFRAGMIEAWGRGIERILLACRAAGTPRPKVRFDHGGLWVVFPYPAGREAMEGKRLDERVGEKVGEKVGENLTANQKQMLALLRQKPRIAAPELARHTGISKRKIETNIAKLKAMGYLQRIGPAKGGRWKVLV